MHAHRLARRLIQAVVPATPSEPALTDPPKPGGKAILDDCDIHFVPLRWSAKTGTLTAGVMQFERATDPIGAASPRPLTLAISTVDSKRGSAVLSMPRFFDRRLRTSRATGRSMKSPSISSAACRSSWRLGAFGLRVHNGTDAVRVMSYRRSTVRSKDDHAFGNRDHISDVGTIADPASPECGLSGRNDRAGAGRGRGNRPRPPHAGLARGRRPVAAARARVSSGGSDRGRAGGARRAAVDRDRPSMVVTASMSGDPHAGMNRCLPLPSRGFVDTGQQDGSAESAGSDRCARPHLIGPRPSSRPANSRVRGSSAFRNWSIARRSNVRVSRRSVWIGQRLCLHTTVVAEWRRAAARPDLRPVSAVLSFLSFH
jgi:hypothetical protein